MAGSLFFKAFVLCLSVLLAIVSVQAQLPDPNDDPFYKVPSNIATYAKGQVVKSRKVQTPYVLNVASSYQYQYRTNDIFGAATATVGTVWVPLIPASPPKIVLYSVAEDSIQLDCAPSWGWVNSSSQFYTAEKNLQAPILIPFAVTQGFYVVNTDAEGPLSALLSGLTEGQSALDGVKGAINLLTLSASKSRVALIGYSGGAHTSIWASTLAKSYAPELNLVGAAMGGTPVDLASAFQILDNTTQSNLVAGTLFGLGNANPSLNATITKHLNPKGVSVSRGLRARNYCIPGNTDIIVPASVETLFDTPPTEIPAIVDAVNAESLLSNVTTRGPIPVPAFPRLEYHGSKDTTVPYNSELQYVQQQCGKGADIRFVTFAGQDHAGTAILGLVGALSFVAAALQGTVAPASCGSPTTMPAPGSSAAVKLLGPILSDAFCKLAGGC